MVGNDISGFADPDYLPVCGRGRRLGGGHPHPPAPAGARPRPALRRRGGRRCATFLADRAGQAAAAGIPPERIMVDAGLDLGKTEAQSLVLLRASPTDWPSSAHPVFLSASNKRFLWTLLDVDRASAGDGTMAAHTLGIALGCRILRAHDVRNGRAGSPTSWLPCSQPA